VGGGLAPMVMTSPVELGFRGWRLWGGEDLSPTCLEEVGGWSDGGWRCDRATKRQRRHLSREREAGGGWCRRGGLTVEAAV
jgi:hypothetical protein